MIKHEVVQAVLEFDYGESLIQVGFRDSVGWNRASIFDIYQRHGGSNSYWSTIMRLGSL